jgi:hypothetical protein
VTPYRIAVKFWEVLNVEDQALIGDTLQALVDHELADVAANICRRIFAKEQDIDRVLDADARGLTPFVTLVPHDLRWVATVPGWTPAMRRERADEALSFWGFERTVE